MAIIQIESLNLVLPYLRKDSLLLVDIDDTLIRSTNPLYDDPNHWFRTHFNQMVEDNKFRFHSKTQEFMSYYSPTYMKMVKEFNSLVESSQWTDIENSGALLQKWKERALGVWGITARGIELQKTTEAALLNNNLYFPKHNIYHLYTRFINNKHPERSGRSYKRKIIYCGGRDKGKILVNHHRVIIPNHVVMIDDSLRNLHEVKRSLNKIGSTFIGLHYVPQV